MVKEYASKNKITSEFGRRDEIALPGGSVTLSGHTGMGLGNGTPMGTPILAVNDGEIVYVRNHKVGLALTLRLIMVEELSQFMDTRAES